MNHDAMTMPGKGRAPGSTRYLRIRCAYGRTLKADGCPHRAGFAERADRKAQPGMVAHRDREANCKHNPQQNLEQNLEPDRSLDRSLDRSQTEPGPELGPAMVLPSVRRLVTYSLAYLDRTNFGFGAAAGLAATLTITDKQTSLLSGLFFLGYFAFQLPGAASARRRSAGWLVLAALLAWGTFAALTGVIRVFWLLALDRFLVGVAESVIFPSDAGSADALVYACGAIAGQRS